MTSPSIPLHPPSQRARSPFLSPLLLLDTTALGAAVRVHRSPIRPSGQRTMDKLSISFPIS